MVEVGKMYMVEGSLIVVYPTRVTESRVDYTDDLGFYSGSMPRKEFEKGTVPIIAYRRRK